MFDSQLQLPKIAPITCTINIHLLLRAMATGNDVSRIGEGQLGGVDVPHCWICHEEGTNELGEPLRRDCSCRGSDAGYAHLSCLVKYAKQKTKQWDGRDLGKLRMIWADCLCCKQPFQNELEHELVTEFLSFVETNYPDNQGMYLIASYEKLASLTNMTVANKNKCTQASQEANNISNKMFSIIEQIKITQDPFLVRVKYIEPRVYNILGRIALEEGTKESAQKALAHFEKYRDLCSESGLIDENPVAEHNISIAKEKCGQVSMCIKKKLEQSQKLYNVLVVKEGEGTINTLICGKNLAKDLYMAHRNREAERLLEKLAEISKRVHGEGHSVTKSIHSEQLLAQRSKQFARAICIVAAIVSVFLFYWQLVFIFEKLNIYIDLYTEELPRRYHFVIFLFWLTIILCGPIIILCFVRSALRTARVK